MNGPFHMIAWENDFINKDSKESWREAHKTVVKLGEDLKRNRGRPKKDDKGSIKLNKAEEIAKEIKTSLYTLGKNPENLTENQVIKLELIAKSNPRWVGDADIILDTKRGDLWHIQYSKLKRL